MRHRRFDVATLHLEQVPVPLKAGYLLVVDDGGSDELQWECLAYALDPAEVPRGRYRVDLTTLEGRVIGGMAVLVRSIEGTHVLRGDGPIEGVRAQEVGD